MILSENHYYHWKLQCGRSKIAQIGILTNYIQQVGVFETPVFILHHTGVVPFIRWNHWLHYESPHVVSDLKDWGQKIKSNTWFGLFFSLYKNGQKHTLNPPILWSFLNTFPFLYQRREGTGFPVAWHRNFTVLLAGTAWSCFSIFSGITHCGANANEETRRGKHHDYNHLCLHWFMF